MQALILFVLFGIFATTVGGVISYSTESTTAFTQATVNAQQRTFDDLATVVNGIFSPTYLDLPAVGSTTNPAVYFCAHVQTSRLLDCSGGTPTQPSALDQWGNAVTGYMRRYPTTTLASSGAGGLYSVKAPVTGVVLVSAGPDGKLDYRLQNALNALSAGSTTLANIMAVSAQRQSDGNAGDSLDDVVIAFSNQQSQQDAIGGYQADLNRIAASALLNYQGQFAQYQPQLANVYAGQFNSGPININDTLLQRWRTNPVSGTAVPTFTAASLDAFGATPEINEIQRGLCDTGATNCPRFALGLSGTQSTLNFWLVPQNGVAWAIPNNTSTGTAPTGCATMPPVNCTQVFIKGS